jgi:hypothetical protein
VVLYVRPALTYQKKIIVLITESICVSYGSHNKQRVLHLFDQILCSKRTFAKYCVIPYAKMSGIVKPISATNKTCVTDTRPRFVLSLNALMNTDQTPSTLARTLQDGCLGRVGRFMRVPSSSPVYTFSRNEQPYYTVLQTTFETLCYKPEGRGFDSRCHWIFQLTFNASSRTMARGSTKPLTEMSTRNLPGGKKRPARKAGNFTDIREPII